MKYFSEGAQHINAECENCKRVLKIKRENCMQVDSGYKLNTPIRCFCNSISETIQGKAHITASNVPRCPTCSSTSIQKITLASKAGKVALFGIFAIGKVGKTFKCNNCGYQW
jgi:uncharacterized Zn finger protein